MALYNSSAFGNISGEVLGVVASSNKGVHFIKGKAKTTDAKTQKQLARRAIYEKFCKVWESKYLELHDQTARGIYIKKETFRLCLGNALKFSPSASELWLILCPDDGTMSAPIFSKTEVTRKGDVGFTLYGDFLFPAVANSTDFVLFSGSFGMEYFDNLKPENNLTFYPVVSITDRQQNIGNRVPNNDYMATVGQKTFRCFWYVNKKTGQVSKPLCLACDDSGNVETFYPFGK